MKCNQCGMTTEDNEYHPFAACLMFRSCRDSSTVRENLLAVQARSIALAAQGDNAAIATE